MALQGEYEPSGTASVADQVARYEASDGRDGGTLDGLPVVILTTRGRRSGNLRKNPVMRVERGGTYALVASAGGSPTDPEWYLNILHEPVVVLQDGANVGTYSARTATPAEKADWWPVAVAAYAPYEDYRKKVDRDIPVVLLDRI